MENVNLPTQRLDISTNGFRQSVWLQDIPLRSKPIPHDPKASDDFAATLQRMLHAVNVKPALSAMISDNVCGIVLSPWPTNQGHPQSIQTFLLSLLTSCVSAGIGQMSRLSLFLPLLEDTKDGQV